MDFIITPRVFRSGGFYIGDSLEERGPYPLRWFLVIPLEGVMRERSVDLKKFLKKHYPRYYDELESEIPE